MTGNLVISPVGDQSMHRTWINGPGKPNFDLFLIYYGDKEGTAACDARYYVRHQGFKLENLHFVVQHYSDTLRKYDRIWCPDDDIACWTADVNLLFDIFERHQLQLAQPSIGKGVPSYRGLLRRHGNLLRYSPFVEVMCPLFTREAFFKVADTFLESRSAWGVDWIWPKRFAPQAMAIIDKVAVHHTRSPGSGDVYKNLRALGVDPMREFCETVARHGGIDWSIHRRMLRGRQRMKRIKDPDDNRSIRRRIYDQLLWLSLKRPAA